MDILFNDKRLESLCLSQRQMTKKLGGKGARKLRARLADLQAAADVSQLHAGRPHALKRDRAGQFSVDLDGGRRLVFEPAHHPPPQHPDGSIDWRQVRAVRVVFIGDYHD